MVNNITAPHFLKASPEQSYSIPCFPQPCFVLQLSGHLFIIKEPPLEFTFPKIDWNQFSMLFACTYIWRAGIRPRHNRNGATVCFVIIEFHCIWNEGDEELTSGDQSYSLPFCTSQVQTLPISKTVWAGWTSGQSFLGLLSTSLIAAPSGGYEFNRVCLFLILKERGKCWGWSIGTSPLFKIWVLTLMYKV